MAYATKQNTTNGVKPLGSNLYGICSTASATATKVVSMPDFDVLVEGVTIHVYFANKNTASNPTLQVGSTEAKVIMYNGQADGSWEDGGFISFTYYSGSWHQNDITVGGVTYTFTISGHTMTITGSDGSVQTVTLPDDDTKYTAGTGLELNETVFNHKNAVSPISTEGLYKIKYDSEGHLTGSSAVEKTDITGLGIPGNDTNNRRGFYGTCSTAAATAAKVVTLSNATGWELLPGTIVGVKFTNTNTAENPTLNVNGTGAKTIWYGQAIITTANLNKAGYANRYEFYMYDGSHWVWIGWGVDDNTWQSNTNAQAGYVASGANHSDQFWKTSADGTPAWRTIVHVTEVGRSGDWTYRKWSDGKREAWYAHNYGSQSGAVWINPIYYKEYTITPPAVIGFTPLKCYIMGNGNQQWIFGGAQANTGNTGFLVRMIRPASSAAILNIQLYVHQA